jgi:hypothetical protein
MWEAGQMAIRTPFTELFGVDHPLALAPMGGVSGGALAAAVSEAGGLGQAVPHEHRAGAYGFEAGHDRQRCERKGGPARTAFALDCQGRKEEVSDDAAIMRGHERETRVEAGRGADGIYEARFGVLSEGGAHDFADGIGVAGAFGADDKRHSPSVRGAPGRQGTPLDADAMLVARATILWRGTHGRWQPSHFAPCTDGIAP